jgi:photosystem II stability/assembly factor-like uncharacterized protein
MKLLVGTKKGAFIYESDARREAWKLSEPFLTGWTVHHMAADKRRDTARLYAAANHWAWGPSVAKSDDGGKEWDWKSPGLAFPKDMGVTVGNVWEVAPGPPNEPGVVYAGVQPAGLFRSEDWGANWTPVESLNRHPTREKWSGTGGGDSCVNSIEIDPRDARHMYAVVSAGGAFVTHDGGGTWEVCTHNVVPTTQAAVDFNAEIAKMFPMEDVDPVGQTEVHRLRIDMKNPSTLWAQAHTGVFRSTDGAETWTDVTEGLPSFHGFPMAVSRRGPDAAYVVPLAFGGMYNNFRVVDGQFAVYRTQDGGTSWQALTNGLPGPHDYQSVYREGLDTDGADPEGVYVGTSNGEVYASIDRGDHWQRLPGTLPPILSVTCADV